MYIPRQYSFYSSDYVDLSGTWSSMGKRSYKSTSAVVMSPVYWTQACRDRGRVRLLVSTPTQFRWRQRFRYIEAETYLHIPPPTREIVSIVRQGIALIREPYRIIDLPTMKQRSISLNYTRGQADPLVYSRLCSCSVFRDTFLAKLADRSGHREFELQYSPFRFGFFLFDTRTRYVLGKYRRFFVPCEAVWLSGRVIFSFCIFFLLEKILLR